MRAYCSVALGRSDCWAWFVDGVIVGGVCGGVLFLASSVELSAWLGLFCASVSGLHQAAEERVVAKLATRPTTRLSFCHVGKIRGIRRGRWCDNVKDSLTDAREKDLAKSLSFLILVWTIGVDLLLRCFMFLWSMV